MKLTITRMSSADVSDEFNKETMAEGKFLACVSWIVSISNDSTEQTEGLCLL